VDSNGKQNHNRPAAAPKQRERGGGMSWPNTWPMWRQFTLALATIAASVAIRWALDPILGDRVPFIALFMVLLPLTLLVNPKPFLLAAIVGVLSVQFLFVTPRFSFGMASEVPLVQFVLAGTAIGVATITAWLSERVRRRALAAEAMLRAFVDDSPSLKWVTDGRDRIVYANRAMATALGKTIAEIQDRKHAELLPEETANKALERIHLVRSTGIPDTAVEALPSIDRSAPPRVLEWRRFPLRLSDAADLLVAGMAIDVTDKVEMARALQEADRRKDEFLATMAHELRNPLAPIRNSVEFLKLRDGLSEDVAQCRDVIDRQVQHMSRLLEDLLDVSRIAHGKLELRPEPVDFASVISDSIETSRPLIDEAGHELEVILPDEPILVRADRIRLAQVFSNLLNNAAKYTERGGHIRLTASMEDTDVAVSVRDDGIGIEPAALSDIFTMFSQAKPALDRAQGGLGIGLALAKGLVSLHGGKIDARSEGPGHGSEFIVRLPAITGLSRRQEFQQDGVRVAAAGHPRKILVVDDLKDSCDTLALLLRAFGHLVETAYDGEEGVLMAERFRPEVILLDIGMPKMNGYDACERIRSAAWGKSIFIIAVTGWGQEDDRRRTEGTGFDAHLIKPTDPALLLDLLKTTSRTRDGTAA
jgi:PAS domain S-box-containing protein